MNNKSRKIIISIIIVALIVMSGIWIINFKSNVYNKDKTIYLGEYSLGIDYGKNKEGHFDLQKLEDNLLVNYEYNKKYKVITIAKGDYLIRYNYDKDILFVNNEKMNEFDGKDIIFDGDKVYVSKEFMEKYLLVEVVEAKNNIVVKGLDHNYKVFRSIEDRIIYSELNKELGKIKENQIYYLIEEGESRNLVISEDYKFGYVKKNYKDPAVSYTAKSSYRVDKHRGKKIALLWEQVFKGRVNTDKIGDLGKVNVISPTWLSVVDEKGTVQSKIDYDYLKWAKKNNYDVWVLVDNSFDTGITNGFLNDLVARENVIRQLEEVLKISYIDGINLDFENVYLRDKDILVQFVGELLPIVHKYEKTLSIDVTVMGGSDTWSNFLDRRRLGKIVDFMAVMTYDEHWASSPNSGSVASLPWVSKGMERISEIVDKDKLLVGIPLYTRIWYEKPQYPGKVVKQDTKSMNYILELVRNKNLQRVWKEDLGQNYVEYREDGYIKKIWLEDFKSIEKKIQLVNDNNYRGIGIWKRGLESPGVWKLINDTLN